MSTPASASPPAPSGPPARLSMHQVLLCGALVVTLSMGIRHGFCLWLGPITQERGWTRETFAFAMAALIDLVRKGKPGEGMAEAVRQMGVVLAAHFPRGSENPNELPDRLIEL